MTQGLTEQERWREAHRNEPEDDLGDFKGWNDSYEMFQYTKYKTWSRNNEFRVLQEAFNPVLMTLERIWWRMRNTEKKEWERMVKSFIQVPSMLLQLVYYSP